MSYYDNDDISDALVDEEIRNVYEDDDSVEYVDDDSEEELEDTDDDDDDDDEDDEEEEEYVPEQFDKFSSHLSVNQLLKAHPECIVKNMDEVKTLCKITYDKNGNINDELHKTLPFLTKYEKTSILGKRAKQIENGSAPFVDVPENIIEPLTIAELEYDAGVLPFIICRPLPNGGSEYWNLNDLEKV